MSATHVILSRFLLPRKNARLDATRSRGRRIAAALSPKIFPRMWVRIDASSVGAWGCFFWGGKDRDTLYLSACVSRTTGSSLLARSPRAHRQHTHTDTHARASCSSVFCGTRVGLASAYVRVQDIFFERIEIDVTRLDSWQPRRTSPLVEG